MAVNSISIGGWCGYCDSKLSCRSRECKFCYDKSIAFLIDINLWSLKNILQPWEIFRGSDKICYFICKDCGHDDVPIRTANIKYRENKIVKFCGYCNGERFCLANTCDFCFEKSFESFHECERIWYPENPISPMIVPKHSGKKYKFICELNGCIYESTPHNIVRGNRCGICKNKTEKIVLDFLKTKYLDIEHQKKFEWCKKNYLLRYDFYIPSKNLIIEIDGRQHFISVKKFKNSDLI